MTYLMGIESAKGSNTAGLAKYSGPAIPKIIHNGKLNKVINELLIFGVNSCIR